MLNDIKTRTAEAARKAGRNPDDITLIAVSKMQPLDRLDAVLAQGHRVFGENYVQEAAGKWPPRRQGVQLHMIGPLQSNKARAAADLFDAIHSLDRMSLAKKLAALDHIPDLFVQVNTGAEPQKAGIAPHDLAGFLAAIADLGLRPRGLMCIPPTDADPVPHFRMLRELRDANGLRDLSMGMSSDFEAAIAQGATHIRVGSAIFGARPPR